MQMSNPARRIRGGLRCCATCVALAAIAWAAPAGAMPIDVFFDGPVDAAQQHFGIDQAKATEANGSPFDIPLIAPAQLMDATGIIDIFSQNLDLNSVVRNASDNSAMSTWEIQNTSNVDYMGDVFVLFLTSDPFVVDYAEENVGLTLDRDLADWVIVPVSVGDEDFFYPALRFDSLTAGGVTPAFNVFYRLMEPIQGSADEDILPQLRIGFGFTPIPEPGTALLLSGGLLGLVLLRRRSDLR